MIELSHVTKCFNSGRPNQFTAVDDVSLHIAAGRVTVLKGPSGSGKTTLLSLIGCMARPTTGRISLCGTRPAFLPESESQDGIDISSLPERFLTEIRRSAFGFIFQQFNLIRGITVLENVMLPVYPNGMEFDVVRDRAHRLLELLRIERHAGARVDWLSGGELQRVAIARALINNPSLIIADEPTAHLDSRLSAEFMDIVAGLKDEGRTVLIASHDPLVYENGQVDAVVELRDGRIIGNGSAP